MKRIVGARHASPLLILVILILLGLVPISVGTAADSAIAALAATAGQDNPWAAWPYRLKLRVVNPELADFTQMAVVRVNLGDRAASDCHDVLVIDAKGYEREWRLLSRTTSGDATIVFRTLKGVRDYDLLFGNPEAKPPRYPGDWPIGRVIIDDFLPKGVYIHGLWSWVKSPTLSGVYAHTSPITDRVSYHGTSLLSNQLIADAHREPLYETSVINQFVCLDKDNPPDEIVLRLVFESRRGANSWDDKRHVNLSWGPRNIRGLTGRTVKVGERPPLGSWERLSVKVGELLRQTNVYWEGGEIPELFGIEFLTDKGRAWWDLTTIADVPAEVCVVGVERTGPGVKPTFVYQRLQSFVLPGDERPLSRVQLFATAGEKTRCRWEFEGVAPDASGQVGMHVFRRRGDQPVSLTVTEPDGQAETVSSEVKGLGTDAPKMDFGIDLVSCPFIVRADDKALFNLRLEADLTESLPVEVRATLLDANDAEIRRETAEVVLLPGDKHPAFKAFSFDVGDEGLSRIRFEMRLGGHVLARRVVSIQSSRSVLELKLSGDRYVDAFGVNPVVVRCEIAAGPQARPPRSRTGLPRRMLVIGRIPSGESSLAERLKQAVAAAVPGTQPIVRTTGVDTYPAWSMPFRQVIELRTEKIEATTQVIIVASATEMMLAGVPASAGADAVAVMVDQIRRQSDAEIFLLTPAGYADLEDLARQYTVALRMLGIEKDVSVIDVYSRSARLGDRNPELFAAAAVKDGIFTRELHPRIVEEIVTAILEDLRSATLISRTSE